MTTFMKEKFKKSDGLTNIDNYRVAAHKYYRISYNFQIWIKKPKKNIHESFEIYWSTLTCLTKVIFQHYLT